MKQQCVIFDMDGVICHTNPDHGKAFEAFFDKYQISHSQKEFEEHMYGKHNGYIMTHFFKRPIAGEEPDPRWQRGVRASEPLVRTDDAAGQACRRAGSQPSVRIPRQERREALRGRQRPPPRPHRQTVSRSSRAGSVSVHRR